MADNKERNVFVKEVETAEDRRRDFFPFLTSPKGVLWLKTSVEGENRLGHLETEGAGVVIEGKDSLITLIAGNIPLHFVLINDGGRVIGALAKEIEVFDASVSSLTELRKRGVQEEIRRNIKACYQGLCREEKEKEPWDDRWRWFWSPVLNENGEIRRDGEGGAIIGLYVVGMINNIKELERSFGRHLDRFLQVVQENTVNS